MRLHICVRGCARGTYLGRLDAISVQFLGGRFLHAGNRITLHRRAMQVTDFLTFPSAAPSQVHHYHCSILHTVALEVLCRYAIITRPRPMPGARFMQIVATFVCDDCLPPAESSCTS